MAKKKIYDDDDGRTVADMSEVERTPILIPKLDRIAKARSGRDDSEESNNENDYLKNEMSNSERRAFVSGAVSAALAIGSVFAVAIGVVILLISKLGS